MPFFRRTGPNWVNAEHPGYRSKKEEERGGSRRDIAKAVVSDIVTRKTTRREPKLPEHVHRKVQAMIKEKEDREAAQAAARRERKKRAPEKLACTCRKPRLNRKGLCTRCHLAPAAGRRRR